MKNQKSKGKGKSQKAKMESGWSQRDVKRQISGGKFLPFASCLILI
jgi:hypothetical protein